ncbi:gliding motility-associated C-terminal domain-containing protein, partial [Aestuariivivens sp. NBU2969]|uniref:T9SS type B sorting domain-containing protein n=1 Tax=Aestuariivivens sp. NBU2969 TaxID=2873267 RepID=UPI001CBD36FA
SCDQVITIEDTTPPVITCPSDLTIACDADSTPANTGSATATDNCDGSPVITFVDVVAAGTGNNSVITRTWTATDANNNSSSCDQVITVVDSTAPVPDITTLPGVTSECSVTLTPPTATDNCSGTIVGITTDPTYYNVTGTYTVTWEYTDGNGNVSSQDQVVIITSIPEPVSSGDQLYCEGDPIPELSVTVRSGDTVDWYNQASDGTLLLADSTTFTPSGPGTYYAEARDILQNCVSTSRVAITLTMNILPIIDDIAFSDPTFSSCPALDDGTITITATGTNLEYSIDGGVTYQSSNTFNDLMVGDYTIAVRDSINLCETISSSITTLSDNGCIASIVITKTQTTIPNTVTFVGQVLEYEITIENTGNTALHNIDVQDLLPDGTQGSLSGPFGDSNNDNALDVDEVWTYTITYTVTWNDALAGLDLVNEASVTSDEIDTPESDTAVTPINTLDLEIEKTVDRTEVLVGDLVVFTIVVSNLSDFDATNVEINEVIPSGYEFVSATITSGSYSDLNGLWVIPNISGGGIEILEITVRVLPMGDYINVAEIQDVENGIDINPDNNRAEAFVEPNCLTIYNEFSPNGDGDNDTFVIDCVERYPESKLEVYNRWGTKVYEVRGYQNDWDGTSNESLIINGSEKLPTGTYYYVLDLKDGSKPRIGWLYINR